MPEYVDPVYNPPTPLGVTRRVGAVLPPPAVLPVGSLQLPCLTPPLEEDSVLGSNVRVAPKINKKRTPRHPSQYIYIYI